MSHASKEAVARHDESASAAGVLVVVRPTPLELRGRRDGAQRPLAHGDVDDDARIFNMAAGSGPHATFENALGDIDLMLFAIDVSLGPHVAFDAAYWMPRVQSDA